MDYNECLAALTELGHELRGVRFTLEVIERVLESLGNPHLHYPTAIVAGTNGKGSTSAILAGILENAGYRVGLYTSPHLIRVNERIRVDFQEISDADFACSFTEVWENVGRLLATGLLPARPSFFECLTATAFLHFARLPVDFAVLEVGMGGRLDATNVTEPRVAVITNIELDHQEFLGQTHAAIAGEKAGVIKPGRPVVSSCEHPHAAEVIRRRCRELGAPLLETPSFSGVSDLRGFGGRYTFDLTLNGDRYSNLTLPLLGRFQVKNAVTAVTAAWRLAAEGVRVPHAAIEQGLRRACWPGRLEIICEQPLVVLDGAHNLAGACEVAAFVKEDFRGRTLRLVYASMRDKAIGEITKILFPLAEEVYLTRPDQPRAATPDEILSVTQTRPPRIEIEDNPARAFEKAFRASSLEDVVLVTGSLFLVGAIKKAQVEGKLELGGRPIFSSGRPGAC